jgi:two-component system, NarL family, sensor kinase
VRTHAEEQLRQLSLRLMTLRDNERRRIARDLHDSLGQLLTAVKMNVAYLGRNALTLDECGRKVLAESKELVDTSLQEVRTLAHLLHPPMLDEMGLLPAIRWFVSGFSQRSGIDVQLELPESLRRLRADLETAAFRVIQESLTNVHRHSRASAAKVRFTTNNSELNLVVHDNGHGIDSTELQKFREARGDVGIGITGMRERIRELGGTLSICSDQSGTTLSVRVPAAEALTSHMSMGAPAA